MNASSRNLSKRLVLYGLGAGAVAVAAAGAHAKGKGKGGKGAHAGNILYSGPVEYSGNTIHFDLQNIVPPSSSFFSGDDFKMKSDCTNAYAKIAGEGSYNPKIAGFFDCGEIYASKLSAGDTIGLQNFFTGAYFDDVYSGPGDAGGSDCGEWKPGDRGFLALRIRVDCNTAYYGWADVSLNTLDCEVGPIFTLHSYALNTEPNESLQAGEKKAKSKHFHLQAPTCTPTPSPTPTPTPTPPPERGIGSAIALLIAGASGIPSLKRRREALSSL